MSAIKALARSHSKDPLQEHLRQRKEEWNAACSEFIAEVNAFKPHLISFKRGLNGRGDAKASIPVSDIRDPLPAKVQSYSGALANEFSRLENVFQKLIQESKSIINEQANYSAKRKKNVRRSSNEQSFSDDQIIIEGSNKLTRFWANLSTSFSKNPFTQARISLLEKMYDFYRALLTLENDVLAKGTSNVQQVLEDMLIVSNKYKGIVVSYRDLGRLQKMNGSDIYSEFLNKNKAPISPSNSSVPAKDEELPKISPQQSSDKQKPKTNIKPPSGGRIDYSKLKAGDIRQNIIHMINADLGFSDADAKPVISMYTEFNHEKNPDKKAAIEKMMQERFAEAVEQYRLSAQRVLGRIIPEDIPLYQIVKLKDLDKNSAIQDEALVKEAMNNYLSRLVKHYSHYFGLKDMATAPRLELFRIIRHIKKLVDTVMDLLENKFVNIESLDVYFHAISFALIDTDKPIQVLNILHKDPYYQDNKNLTRVINRQVRKDEANKPW